MGWCHEFGPDISDTCDHPMTAGADRCFCEVCGIECKGRFAGCVEVWAQGPKDVTLIRPRSATSGAAARATSTATATATAERAAESFQAEQTSTETQTADVGAEGFDPVVAAAAAPAPGPGPGPGTAIERPEAEHGLVGVRVWSEPDEERLIADLVDRVTARVADTVDQALTKYQGSLVAVPAFDTDVALNEQVGSIVSGIQAQCEAMLHGLQVATQELSQSVAGVQEFADSLREQLQIDWMSDELGASVKEVREVSSELREELARLAAFRRALADGYPAVARAVEYASVKAATRFAELTRAVTDLTPAAAAVAVASSNGHSVAVADEPDPVVIGDKDLSIDSN